MADRGDDHDAAADRGGAQGMNQGMQVLSYLISGVVLYGGLGWLGDHLLGTAFLLPAGIVLGAGFGIYLVIARFGAEEARAGTPPARRAPGQQDDSTGTQTTSRTREGTT